MTKTLSLLAAGIVLVAGTAAFAQDCPSYQEGVATQIVAERAYDLRDGKTYNITVGGPGTSNCLTDPGLYLPSTPTIQLDLSAAEGKDLIVTVQSDCAVTDAWGNFKESTSSGFVDVPNKPITFHFKSRWLGNDKSVLVSVGGTDGETCAGTVTFQTVRS